MHNLRLPGWPDNFFLEYAFPAFDAGEVPVVSYFDDVADDECFFGMSSIAESDGTKLSEQSVPAYAGLQTSTRGYSNETVSIYVYSHRGCM